MKYQIRQNVFETNSSSTHSLSLMSSSDYKKWINGELKYGINTYNFKPVDEADKSNKEILNRYIKKGWFGESIEVKDLLSNGYYYDLYVTYDEFYDIYLKEAEVIEKDLNSVHAISYYKYD